MGIIAAYMVPHPPMIVPQIGRGSEKQIETTTRAYEAVADEIAQLRPETIIITSPHSIMYSDYFHISPGKKAGGSFVRFGVPEVRFDEEYDTELREEICAIADANSFPAGTLGEQDPQLDHGCMVPLYFIRKAYRKLQMQQSGNPDSEQSGAQQPVWREEKYDFRILRIALSGLPLTDHYRLGQMIRQAADELGRRTVLVASGDLSHKLQDYGPYGYAPEGPQYDARIMDVCARAAFGELFDFTESFCDKAAECGHRSFVIMAGALDGMEVAAKQLSHEDVTGVGYGICTFHPLTDSGWMPGSAGKEASGPAEKEASRPAEQKLSQKASKDDRKFLDRYLEKTEEAITRQRDAEDPYVRLARQSLESYILKRQKIRVPEGLPADMKTRRAGVFVSIHKHDRLRGCIGTILPTTGSIAEEIIRNAISASTQDPRFEAITPDELKWLDVSVDVLGEPERIGSIDELDVKRYGVIVTSGARRGLLLPDLDGVDTPEQQVSIAMRKGGIDKDDPVVLERFEVIRHHTEG
ncbi:MAG: AmmeMemoRadiSam system protein A [Eubacterium sp.]|nr:AmmeMemoRadiSam system protein A [Eubacterium sp.]